MLRKFYQAKLTELEVLQKLEEKGQLPSINYDKKPSFVDVLKNPANDLGIAVIAEYKRASPSVGLINIKYSPEEIAKYYSENGASAISVLTEQKYFQGDLIFLDIMAKANLPLLRKDFIFHELQIRATAATKASALLLIVALTPDILQLRHLIEYSNAFNIDAVVEIFNEQELKIARAAGAKIIQVNNRDLNSLKIDLTRSVELGKLRSSDELWIAASGIKSALELQSISKCGYNAALIGTSLMMSENPGLALRGLFKEI